VTKVIIKNLWFSLFWRFTFVGRWASSKNWHAGL